MYSTFRGERWSLFSYLLFITTMSFTPGPNTIMAMSEGQRKGFISALPFNLGVFIGIVFTLAIALLFSEPLKHNHSFIFIMKIIGTLYLLYLAYHVFISKPDSAKEALERPILKGILIQATNIKAMLYFLTGLTTFTLPDAWNSTFVRSILLIVIGIAGAIVWSLLGQMMNRIYQQHYKIINVVITALLLYSAVELW
ncbi:LysE family translocator [Staphylococcus borealis]|uniref:LysE family translocator n=1 Tax=Staphylococcus borealis TaxID=2742203 RepID=UPI0025A229FC|nr:LysE family translocator [Staphylococcus borealis]